MNTNIFRFSNWNDVTNEGRNNLVFENKNQVYGAYYIRREYNNNLIFAIFFSLGSFGLLSLVPYAFSHFKNEAEIIKIPTFNDPGVTVIIPKPVEPLVIPETHVTEVKQHVASQNALAFVATDKPVETAVIPNDAIINPGIKTETGDIPGVDLNKIVDAKPVPTEATTDVPVINPDVMPQFPGGENAMFEYLKRNINYPQEAKELGIRGTVYVNFIIDKTGKVVNINIAKGIRGGGMLDKEVLRVVAAMPLWSAGKQNGQAVSVIYNLPVKFNLQ